MRTTPSSVVVVLAPEAAAILLASRCSPGAEARVNVRPAASGPITAPKRIHFVKRLMMRLRWDILRVIEVLAMIQEESAEMTSSPLRVERAWYTPIRPGGFTA